MNYKEGKARFVEQWGILGSQWGINRTMAQIHAILLIAPHPLCSEEIMQELQISRGNTCMNLKQLLDWELVSKTHKPGDRKEYYLAEKDIWKLLQHVIKHRKRKELEPMIAALDEVSEIDCLCESSAEFCKMVSELKQFSKKVDKIFDTLINTDDTWLNRSFMKMIR